MAINMYMAAAKDIAQMLHADSHIPVALSIMSIAEALEKDGRLPSSQEKDHMVFGDDDGSVDDVGRKFPETVRAIARFF